MLYNLSHTEELRAARGLNVPGKALEAETIIIAAPPPKKGTLKALYLMCSI